MTAKLAFAFPSQPKPGYAMGLTSPEIHFSYDEFPNEHFLILTVGIVGMDDNLLYSLLIHIFFGEEEVTIAPKDDKEITTYHQLNGKSGEVVSYISLTDRFEVKSPGTYRVLLKLVSKSRARDQEWNTIHELESYFAVSTGWDA
ncbi:hypothetical protein N8Q46_07625 [Enterobacter hormaechei subsp. hoffmannii]|nr:hypothetical protein [Enterobacter hormaechei subsp. hoffmannii]MCU3423377.1 hypothetical protein [Enterobacter hormaechei subsp. hoffmannii]MCU3775232.1 hypothetical protein [Enterobacter hormaechei subsp. hoffmannii]